MTESNETVKNSLPPEFLAYVKAKLENDGSGGRKNIVQQLGSLEAVKGFIRFFAETGENHLKTSRKYTLSKMTVYRFVKEIPKLNEVIIYLKHEDEFKIRDFREFDIVKEWEAKIRRSGSLSALDHIPTMANICGMSYVKSAKPHVQGWKCSPEKFDLLKAQEFVDLYLKATGKKILPSHIRMPIRHFLMVAQGISIPRGFGSQFGLSGEKQNYGAYSHIKLSDEEIETARKILKKIDGKTAIALFDWGIESCARFDTLARTEIEKFEDQGEFTTVRVFESKTQKTWTKYLLVNKYPHAKETAEELKGLTREGEKYIFIDRGTRAETEKFMREMSEKMKAVYRELGKADNYFYKKPLHTLRHIGAHLWLRRTNYDYALVAKIGGWDDVQTLIDCYGEMSPETVLSKISKIGEFKSD